MGEFSWLDCNTGRQIKSYVRTNIYVLVPEEFGGGYIQETYYNGYGDFGGKDIYDLVAIWNRKFLAENPSFLIKSIGSPVCDFKWYDVFSNMTLSVEEAMHILKEQYSSFELRYIGIDIACIDVDNEALKYPIKICHDKTAKYEDCPYSPSDPDQGW